MLSSISIPQGSFSFRCQFLAHFTRDWPCIFPFRYQFLRISQLCLAPLRVPQASQAPPKEMMNKSTLTQTATATEGRLSKEWDNKIGKLAWKSGLTMVYEEYIYIHIDIYIHIHIIYVYMCSELIGFPIFTCDWLVFAGYH